MLERYGINLESKRALVEGRLSSVVAQSEFRNFHEYLTHIMRDQQEEQMSVLVSKLTTNYTYFMREPQHYAFMREKALGEWVDKLHDVGEIQIWSAGCSSGEEAYTAAIVADQYLKKNQRHCSVRIRATDISEKVLKQAREGIYPADHVSQLDPAIIDQYFVRLEDGRYQVAPHLARMVRFEKLNLMEPFVRPIRRYQIIFCRNVMIYFKTETKEELSERFYDMLEPGGYFFVGLSETLSNVKTRFDYLAPAIYRKSSD